MSIQTLVERLWDGSAQMEEWTVAVSGGSVTQVTEDIIAVHTTYFCGSTTAIRTAAGLVFVDTGNPGTAHESIAAVRCWDERAVHTVIYTQGHIDHTSGMKLLDAEADAKGRQKPHVIAHRNVLRRFDRYDATHGYNSIVQGNQFNLPRYVYPTNHRRPDEVYDVSLALDVGGTDIQLFHARGETDDATFVWLPRERVLVTGDFVAWIFPNAGNPRKVQRYAAEWADALRRMQALKPKVLIAGHGPVIFGEERVNRVLDDTAAVLEYLVNETLTLINRGATLDEILHSVTVPSHYFDKPYLQAKYDDPEFVVRGIWHLYAGWFDGNPANLKPAKASELAIEVVQLAGGVDSITGRVETLVEQGKIRLATHLIEFAATAYPADREIQALRGRVMERCVLAEKSLIGGNIFAVFERDAKSRSK